MIDDYNDIINLPHHDSKRHKRMPIKSRAAQFQPFAALTGYSEKITEQGRETEKKYDLSEDELEILNQKLFLSINNNLTVEVIYFIYDLKKSGGKYEKTTGKIKFDEYKKGIYINNLFIYLDDILDINLIDFSDII